MTRRIRLLSAAAALAFPAAMASAQQAAPTAPPAPLGGALNPGTQANVPAQPTIPPAETSVLGTQQPAVPTPPEADVAEQAADAVEADAVAQTRVQAAAQGQAPAPAAAPAAPAQLPAQAQAQAPAAPAVPAGPVSHATAADLRAGVQVRDQSGQLVGTVETADAGGAVVYTGVARGRVALSSLGRNNQGLVIGLTKAEFEAAAAAANPS